MMRIGSLLLAAALAASVGGCAATHKTDLFRKDVLTDAQNAIADLKLNQGKMTITASVDREDKSYDPGQPITLTVNASKDAFISILRVMPNGDTQIVFPNRPHRIAWLPAGTTLTLPSADDPVKLAVDKPGIVLFEIIANTLGRSWLFSRAPDEGSDFADLGVTSRNVARDMQESVRIGVTHEVAATYVVVRIAGRDLF
ncbi:MAG TPA: DUF4384 domain-containing protein [Stellaceae bacterium]|jgi:hypothetical protein|nr:DUF4384 domain-containing protein [Stellaceae bacterium]